MFRFHWLVVCAVLFVALALSVPAHAAIYTFESLNSGADLIGQDNWAHANTGAITGTEVKVLAGAGFNTSKVAVPFTGNAQVDRQNNGSFSIPTFSGTEKIYLEADFQYGTQLNAFGLIKRTGSTFTAASPWMSFSSTGSGPTFAMNFNFRPDFSPNQDPLLPQINIPVSAVAPQIQTGDWVRMHMDLDLAANGGKGMASVSYKDLTLGETSFTAVPGLQNLNAGIGGLDAPIPTAADYFWDAMFMRGGISSGNNAMDNLEVGVTSVPEPASIGMLAIALAGLMIQCRRKR